MDASPGCTFGKSAVFGVAKVTSTKWASANAGTLFTQNFDADHLTSSRSATVTDVSRAGPTDSPRNGSMRFCQLANRCFPPERHSR